MRSLRAALPRRSSTSSLEVVDDGLPRRMSSPPVTSPSMTVPSPIRVMPFVEPTAAGTLRCRTPPLRPVDRTPLIRPAGAPDTRPRPASGQRPTSSSGRFQATPQHRCRGPRRPALPPDVASRGARTGPGWGSQAQALHVHAALQARTDGHNQPRCRDRTFDRAGLADTH